jgi:type I restriction enzyme, S subunit
VTVSLGRLVDINPSVPEFLADPDATITFMPLETIWPDGRADISRRALARDVAGSYTLFRKGDVLMPKITPTFEAGRVAVADLDTSLGAATSEVHVLRVRAGLADPRFVAYLCRTQPFLQEGATRLQGVGNLRRVPPDFVARFPVSVVDPSVQRTIADYLDRETARIDTLIEEQQRLIGLLHERRQAAISDALGRSDLVRLGRLVEHGRPMTYGILQCGDLVEDGVPYIGPSDMPGEGASPRVGDLRRTSRDIAKSYSRSTLKGGDVVVSIGPAFGKVALVSDDLTGANLTQDTVRVALDHAKAHPWYVVWALQSREVAQYWDIQIMGATFRRLNLGTLARTPIPLPELDEQRRIANELDQRIADINKLIAEAEHFIELSRERRTALISAAVAGQVDVTREAE